MRQLFFAAIVLPFVLTPAVAEQASSPRVEDAVSDDVTSVLQNHVDVAQGTSRSKSARMATETAEAFGGGSFQTAAGKGAKKYDMAPDVIQKGLAEFVAMTLFVFIGCGSAMALPGKGDGAPGKVFHVSLVFGFAITAIAYSIGHYSGGQINCAVSFGLVISGHLSITQALVNTGFQLLGSICGSLLTLVMFAPKADQTGGLGTNEVNVRDFNLGQALIGEIMGTFLLVFVVHETAVNPATSANRPLACLAIGIAVFLAHSVLIPVDGCSINPTRSFGPMIVRAVARAKGQDDFAFVAHHWVFWVGPLLGAAFAAYGYKVLHAV